MAKKSFAIVALLAVIVVIVFFGYYAWAMMQSGSDGSVPDNQPVSVTIPQGSNGVKIATILEDKHVVKNAFMFKLKLKQDGAGADFKPGKYDMTTGMEYEDILKQLRQGPPITYVDITIPEGWTAKKISDRLAAVTGVDSNNYLQLVTSGNALVQYPFMAASKAPTRNLEGYLYPQTYRIEKKDISAGDFLNMQLQEFQKRTEGLPWTNAQGLGRTPYEIIIIASLIERESMVPDERPLVASVVYNRLRIGMRLQIDATVQYALPVWKDRLTLQDLAVESPYNTYKILGLPPGPICNPSLSSIEAALSPATTDNVYYVLSGDNSGRHVFTKTYDEFLAAKRRYEQYRNSK
jgi:UPF0755 protein